MEEKQDAKELSRREFLRLGIESAAGVCAFSLFYHLGVSPLNAAQTPAPTPTSPSADMFNTDARWWESAGRDNIVRCALCPHNCTVPDGARGLCGVRENRGGKYKTLVYGRPVIQAIHIDPIEKKPLFHYLPAAKALSFGTAGCNFICKFCQNWDLAQSKPEAFKSEYISPKEMVALAKEKQTPVIACTYNEPTIFAEYVYDVAVEGNKEGIKTVMISNGFINEKPLRELCKVLSSIKIDFKAFTEKFYKETCGGEMAPVMNTLKVLKETGIWFEIVTLIIPTLNDDEKENKEMCQWIIKNVGPDVPIHFSQFHPMFKLMNLPRTPLETLEKCHTFAKEAGIHYVYLGNVWNHKYENTFCPVCGKLLIRRQGYFTKIEGLKENMCSECGEKIAGVWG
ncbi:MAG TPA: AmmeMemoRadiSam system radical SAM enzyme [Candidatus Sumerlaeota bacterium]|nr:AmmeMemoRadiSam system radical SAM enzyme [Candidatus Sumerlaeota bacterium]HON51284.1 AmmeMemoRadiSam system radical SAM enzyme [Candidatus Sumerlaeota bacterium]HOR65663.1 AmmeMemoRadiSam system radical SAM enzyme [Candidatus Sumerlaeota bacterium]HPL73767.1 AmmeMemoRadiSam system radical SAM enzyme [Candidatus Sumerlaeota bacterium]HRU55153.1 AmmeMemoRadiSam system radical SAM enzyme [Candidatus Sumerlaeia bacterium]